MCLVCQISLCVCLLVQYHKAVREGGAAVWSAVCVYYCSTYYRLQCVFITAVLITKLFARGGLNTVFRFCEDIGFRVIGDFLETPSGGVYPRRKGRK